ncbi:MAG: hypothetical protein SNG35_05165 [Rikenellaceae bacterium]
MRKFQAPQPMRYYTVMLWLIGALTIAYIAAMIYKGEFITQGLGGYLVAVGVIIPMRGLAYTYVAMDDEALYITDSNPNPLAHDRLLLANIDSVEIRKMKRNELGRYSISIKQKGSLLIETKSLGRFGEREAARLSEALRISNIEVEVC